MECRPWLSMDEKFVWVSVWVCNRSRHCVASQTCKWFAQSVCHEFAICPSLRRFDCRSSEGFPCAMAITITITITPRQDGWMDGRAQCHKCLVHQKVQCGSETPRVQLHIWTRLLFVAPTPRPLVSKNWHLDNATPRPWFAPFRTYSENENEGTRVIFQTPDGFSY